MKAHPPNAARRRRAPLSRGLWYALLLGLLVVPGLAQGAGKQPRRTNGPYNVFVAGSCTGEGHAIVAAGQITITVVVKDESGAQGLLVAPALDLDGSHFSGVGTVLGRPATFRGRLDGYTEVRQPGKGKGKAKGQNREPSFRGARLLCSFTTADGARSGRVAGVLR